MNYAIIKRENSPSGGNTEDDTRRTASVRESVCAHHLTRRIRNSQQNRFEQIHVMKEELTGSLPVGFLPPYSAATPRKEWRKGFSSASYVWALSQFSWVEIHPLSLLVQLGPLASSQSCDPWWQILTPEPYLAEPVPNGNWILGATVTRGKWWVRRSLVRGSPKPVPLSISLLVNILRFNRISEVLSNLKVYGPSGHAALSPSLIHSFVKYLLSTYCVDTNCSHN